MLGSTMVTTISIEEFTIMKYQYAFLMQLVTPFELAFAGTGAIVSSTIPRNVGASFAKRITNKTV